MWGAFCVWKAKENQKKTSRMAFQNLWRETGRFGTVAICPSGPSEKWYGPLRNPQTCSASAHRGQQILGDFFLSTDARLGSVGPGYHEVQRNLSGLGDLNKRFVKYRWQENGEDQAPEIIGCRQRRNTLLEGDSYVRYITDVDIWRHSLETGAGRTCPRNTDKINTCTR